MKEENLTAPSLAHVRTDLAPESGVANHTVDRCPDGYHKIATFQSSDPSFLQYRGFSYLHCRLLSSLQYDVGRLEAELDQLDEWEQKHEDPNSRLVSKDRDDKYFDPSKIDVSFSANRWRSRPQVFAELKQKLMEYGKYIRSAVSSTSDKRQTKCS